ncbi:MAG: queuosine precursor transporter [Methanomicrobiaceae archaeon]|nr:queuosine precursor transporter [Methanomicrobiaceae archaeon]
MPDGILVWVYWLIGLSLVTYLSVYIVRRHREYAFAALTGFYIIYLAASQILATRVIVFDLMTYTFFAPASVFVFPFTAQVIDMINEVYGRRRAHVAVLIAFSTQVLLMLFLAMGNTLAPAPFFGYEEAWQSIFALSLRITAASWVTFLITANLDVYIFAGLKERFKQREEAFSGSTLANPYIWLRSGASDAVNLTLDSVLFVTLAFFGAAPVLPLILGQIVAKNIIGLLDTPWFVWYKSMIGRGETGRNRTGNSP